MELIKEARELLARGRQRALNEDDMTAAAQDFTIHGAPLLKALADEVEKLQRGEFICQRCHLRKDAEFERGDF